MIVKKFWTKNPNFFHSSFMHSFFPSFLLIRQVMLESLCRYLLHFSIFFKGINKRVKVAYL